MFGIPWIDGRRDLTDWIGWLKTTKGWEIWRSIKPPKYHSNGDVIFHNRTRPLYNRSANPSTFSFQEIPSPMLMKMTQQKRVSSYHYLQIWIYTNVCIYQGNYIVSLVSMYFMKCINLNLVVSSNDNIDIRVD